MLYKFENGPWKRFDKCESSLLVLPLSSPSPLRSSRWWCVRSCSSSNRESCSASRWAERSPPPRTPPRSASRRACSPLPRPPRCRAARGAACLACRTTRSTNPGWVPAARFPADRRAEGETWGCHVTVFRQQERRTGTKTGDLGYTHMKTSSRPTWIAVNLQDCHLYHIPAFMNV